MLNWYANTFLISEKNITKAGLRRTKILTWLALMIVPFELMDTDWIENTESVFVSLVFVIFISTILISLIWLLLSPLIHRFWARDKYLDEWEIEVKRKGMSTGYKVLFGIIFIILVFSAFTTDYSTSHDPQISYFQLDSMGFALLVFAFGVQTLTQLSLIRPIDEDDVEADEQTVVPMGARIAVVFAIFFLFFGPAFVQGFIEGFTDGHHDIAPSQKPD